MGESAASRTKDRARQKRIRHAFAVKRDPNKPHRIAEIYDTERDYKKGRRRASDRANRQRARVLGTQNTSGRIG